MGTSEDIAGLAALLIGALVDDPQGVWIEVETAGSTVLLEIHVAAPYVGQVIGRHGRNLAAAQTLIQAFGAKEGRRVLVKLVESGDADPRHPRGQSSPV